MKIGVQTWGSQGDVEPFLALAGGLVEAGHEVRLVVTTQADRPLTPPAGVTTERVGVEMTQAVGDDLFDRVIALKSPVKQGKLVLEEGLLPHADLMFEAAEDLAEDCDLIVRHHFLYMTRIAATKAEVPEVSVFLTPDLLPTKKHPPTGMPSFGPLQSFAWWLANKGISGVFGPPAVALARREGVPTPRGVLRDVWPSETANLVAVSPSLFPRPDDWPESTHLTGFWRGPAASVSEIPADLEDFLDAGEPPVYATFGSMAGGTGARRESDARLLMDAARTAGKRLILQQPPGEPPGIDDEDVFTLNRAPHARVFPRCAAVIHHGGAGTTQTAVRAGVPSIVVPHLADQFFWGEQVERLGIGAATNGRSHVTPDAVARAVQQATADPSARQRAAELGAALDDEDGVATAVDVVTRIGRNSSDRPVRNS